MIAMLAAELWRVPPRREAGGSDGLEDRLGVKIAGLNP